MKIEQIEIDMQRLDHYGRALVDVTFKINGEWWTLDMLNDHLEEATDES